MSRSEPIAVAFRGVFAAWISGSNCGCKDAARIVAMGRGFATKRQRTIVRLLREGARRNGVSVTEEQVKEKLEHFLEHYES